METKVCSKCGIEKDINEFEKRKEGKDGHRGVCDKCRRTQINIKTKIDIKNNSEKYKRKNRKSYLKHREKRIKQAKEYRKNNPKEVRESKKKAYFKDVEKSRLKNRIKYEKYKNRYAEKAKIHNHSLYGRFTKWKSEAKKRNKFWDLTFEYMQSLPLICHYTGVELTLEPNKENTISIERLDSNIGYIKENVVYCCSDINSMKREYPLEYFVSVCEKVTQNKERILNISGLSIDKHKTDAL